MNQIIEHTMDDTALGIVGTGKMATGLGTCFACAGISLCIGSRDPAKAHQFADTLTLLATQRGADCSSLAIVGGSIESLLRQCRVIVLAIPTHITNERGEVIDGVIDFLDHHGDLIRSQRKILVDITYYGSGIFATPTPPERRLRVSRQKWFHAVGWRIQKRHVDIDARWKKAGHRNCRRQTSESSIAGADFPGWVQAIGLRFGERRGKDRTRQPPEEAASAGERVSDKGMATTRI